MNEGRSPLYAEAAEEAVIGSILLCPDAIKHCGPMTPNDFYCMEYRRAYNAMEALAREGRPIDLVTVDEKIGTAYADAAQRQIFEALVRASKSTPSSANIETYAEIVREASFRRAALKIAETLAKDIADSTNDATRLVEQARTKLAEIVRTGQEWERMDEVAMRTYEHVSDLANGKKTVISSGIKTMDNIVGGFFEGEMTVIGSRPSVGKSAFAMHIATEAAKSGKKVCFVSAEMVDVQLGQRILAKESGVDGMRLRMARLSAEDWTALAEGMTRCDGLPVEFLFTKGIEDIVAEARKKADARECDVLIVDYLQFLQSKQRFEADRLRVAYISKALKGLATDMKIPVVVLAQVGRAAAGVCPRMSDLRDSGDIEQDADTIVFLHRPEDDEDISVPGRDKGMVGALRNAGLQYILANVDKCRNGAIGTVGITFDPAHMTFAAITD